MERKKGSVSSNTAGSKIHQFYAVTKSGSLYLATDKWDDEQKGPHVEKIAMVGDSRLGPGHKLNGGPLLGITFSSGLVTFFSDKHNSPASYVTNNRWQSWTSSLIALFQDEKKARACVNSPDLQEWDPRWWAETDEILIQIGPNHRIFRLDPELLERIGLDSGYPLAKIHMN
ncbi:MAG: hypothetical protein Q7S37_04100 [bacterium]|nr:hypothetical protein [bacterium]